MSWSPSKRRSLPSLRPGQSSPLATTTVKRAAPEASQVHSSSGWRSPRKRTAGGPSGLLKSSSVPAQIPNYSQLHIDNKPTPTSGGKKTARPSKEPRSPSKSSKDVSKQRLSFPNPGRPPLTPTPGVISPFFSLTNQEINNLRKRLHRGISYVQFKDTSVARELDRLGRGWKGYLRAKNKAEQEGEVDELWRLVRPEVEDTQLRPGAISVETAALAAQSNYTTSAGGLRPTLAAEVRWLREEPRSLMSFLPGSSSASHESSSSESTIVWRPPSSLPVPEAEPQLELLQRGSPETSNHVPISRPRRVLKRPDYRIQPLPESSPAGALPSRIPSPTPRQIYDKTQPNFPRYQCEWNRCKAILINLDTLQKHIRIVHGNEARITLCCSWESCGTHNLGKYASVEILEHHFETMHLASIKKSLSNGLKDHNVMAKASDVGFSLQDFRSGARVKLFMRDQKTKSPEEWRSTRERLRNLP